MTKPHKRLHTLLTDRAVAGLDARGDEELQYLLAGGAIDPSYAAAAAAIELALHDHGEELPEYVEASVLVQAARYYGFNEASPHDQTVGRAGEDSDFMLGEDSAQARDWEESPATQSAIDSGVLESSLTDGRIEEETNLEESQPGFTPEAPGPDISSLVEQMGRAGKHAPKPKPKLEDEPKPEKQPKRKKSKGKKSKRKKKPKAPKQPPPEDFEESIVDSVEDFDPRSVSQSDLAAAVELSQVQPVALAESRVVRWATYVSALAALVMLAISLWLFSQRDAAPSAGDLRAQVVATEDALSWGFMTKPDPSVGEGASGSVVWSSQLQAGVMVLDGLGVNDPSDLQYQLWIVDKRREGAPVDGGVFNVSASGEIEIPIDAKLVIGEPGAFVITVERPGGVVVSDQERVAMVAAGS